MSNSLRANIRNHLNSEDLRQEYLGVKARLITVFATATDADRDMAYAPTEIAASISHHGAIDEEGLYLGVDMFCVPCSFRDVPYIDTIGTACKNEIDTALLRVEAKMPGIRIETKDERVVQNDKHPNITWRCRLDNETGWYQRTELHKLETVTVLPMYTSDIRIESCTASEDHTQQDAYEQMVEELKARMGGSYTYKHEVSTLMFLPEEMMNHVICKTWVYTMDVKGKCIDLTLNIDVLFDGDTIRSSVQDPQVAVTSMINALNCILPQTSEPIQPTQRFMKEEYSSKSTDYHIQKLCDSANVGPHPQALCRRHVQMIRDADFKISEKTNGFRMLLVQFKNDIEDAPEFSRHLKNTRTGDVRIRTDLTNNEDLDMLGECVLDGELVWNLHFGCMVFMVFDVYALKGKKLTEFTFNQRQEQLEILFKQWHTDTGHDVNNWRIPTFSEIETKPWLFKKLPLVIKKWVDTSELYSELAHHSMDGIYNDGTAWYHHESDGYIAQPADKSLLSEEGKALYKYKIPEDTSVDYRVDENTLGDLGSMTVSYPNAAMRKINVGNVIWNDADKQRLKRRYPEDNTFMFCEFVYHGYWTPIFPRVDKMSANMSVTVMSTLGALKDHMTTDEFIIRMCSENVEATLARFDAETQEVFENILEDDNNKQLVLDFAYCCKNTTGIVMRPADLPPRKRVTVIRKQVNKEDIQVDKDDVRANYDANASKRGQGKDRKRSPTEAFNDYHSYVKNAVISDMITNTSKGALVNNGLVVLDIGGGAGPDRARWMQQHVQLRQIIPGFSTTQWNVIDSSEKELSKGKSLFHKIFEVKHSPEGIAKTAYYVTLTELNKLKNSTNNKHIAAAVAGEAVGISVLQQGTFTIEEVIGTAVTTVQQTLHQGIAYDQVVENVYEHIRQTLRDRVVARPKKTLKDEAIAIGVRYGQNAETPEQAKREMLSIAQCQKVKAKDAVQLAGLAAGVTEASICVPVGFVKQFVHGDADELIYSDPQYQQDWSKKSTQYTAISSMFMLHYLASSELRTKKVMQAFYDRLQAGCCIAICIPNSHAIIDWVNGKRSDPNGVLDITTSYLSNQLQPGEWGQCYRFKLNVREDRQIDAAEYLIPLDLFSAMVREIGFEEVYPEPKPFTSPEFWDNWKTGHTHKRLAENQRYISNLYCAVILKKPEDDDDTEPPPKQMRR